ncbi:uncharacterized protein YcnI [Microbacteriaceae bacterium SG_E_30_P1]|uniref:Uncharacterized protein YcnI n=1 Tax=Antiquaquibacter oligotrophicus TaxID=2880260 RepID=A0ABT6KML5_9MICO|nr:YcnI family protein [Antiquaquibacter oligotrophicus]MDH6181246.1 uncharacterized protein YcnI [Antiquaquibacter oligotrophicus]UDF13059.1 YcnI family protein [Antiquaquibacter oligotrophicus]
MRRTVTFSLIAGALIASSLVVAAPANAHVITETATAPAGSYSVVTFSVLHGCESAGTTAVTIEMPDGVLAVTPTAHWNWVISSDVEPAEVEGTSITERTSSITYTADTPLPSDQRASFELWLGLPDGQVGDVVEFDAIQECEDGAVQEWVGEDAPRVTLTEALAGGGHDHGGAVIPHQAGTHDAQHTEAEATAADPLSRLLAAGALLLGVVAVAIAIAGRQRREDVATDEVSD